jgi:glycosyltransferase involved in cell wall biosynthesis
MSLCLNMIVRQEAKVLPRCLQSVLPLITDYVLVDTGSTDDTIGVIRNALRTIPGKVFERPWVNFGSNRTEALHLAQKHSVSDFILLLDADMELKIDEKLPELRSDTMYSLEQRSGRMMWRNTRIIPRQLKYWYKEPTHEYLECIGGCKMDHNIKAVWIQDHGDGGCKSDKLIRDEKLLRSDLATYPDKARSLFYLGQTLKYLGKWDEAITLLKRRTQVGQFYEEIYMAYIYIAECYKAKGCISEYETNLLEAYQYLPHRVESLAQLSQHYLDQRKYRLACMVLDTAIKIKFPEQDVFLIDAQEYSFGIRFKSMLACNYIPERKMDSARMCLELMAEPKLPVHYRQAIRRDIEFYLQVPQLRLEPVYDLEKQSCQLAQGPWRCSNPCVVLWHNQVWRNIRVVNYFFDLKENRYIYDGKVRTENALLTPDGKEIKMSNTADLGLQRVMGDVVGLEDIRLFVHGLQLFGIATCRELQTSWLNQMVLLHFDDAGVVTKAVPLESPFPNRCEKNWMPLTGGSQMRFVYGWDPLTIVAIDPDSGKCQTVKRIETICHDFRGSSAFIEWDEGGYLGVIHQTFDRPSRHRLYMHRFVVLNADFTIRSESKPFYFQEFSVEFCCGLCWTDASRQSILLSYGFKDAEAFECRMTKTDVQKWLNSE